MKNRRKRKGRGGAEPAGEAESVETGDAPVTTPDTTEHHADATREGHAPEGDWVSPAMAAEYTEARRRAERHLGWP